MKAIRFALGSFLFLALFASASMAQSQRTFVSGFGNDANPCSHAAPCRTFAQAISQTNAEGEVYVLDSAGYGPFTIAKSVSIIAPAGVTAGISVFSSDGIDINAGSDDAVVLRGLIINNQGSTGAGIVFNTGGTLHVESCVVNGFFTGSGGAGISSSSGGRLEVKDSILRRNRTGIYITGPSGVAVDQVRLESNSYAGLDVHSGAKVTVRNSVASNNATGFQAISSATSPVELDVESSVASNNDTGIAVLSHGVTVRLSNSTVTNNSLGLLNFDNGGSGPQFLLLRGNNTVAGNGTDTSGIIGSYTAK